MTARASPLPLFQPDEFAGKDDVEWSSCKLHELFRHPFSTHLLVESDNGLVDRRWPDPNDARFLMARYNSYRWSVRSFIEK